MRNELSKVRTVPVFYVASENFLNKYSAENAVGETVLALSTSGVSLSNLPAEFKLDLLAEMRRMSSALAVQGNFHLASQLEEVIRTQDVSAFTSSEYYLDFEVLDLPIKRNYCLGKKCSGWIPFSRAGFKLVLIRIPR